MHHQSGVIDRLDASCLFLHECSVGLTPILLRPPTEKQLFVAVGKLLRYKSDQWAVRIHSHTHTNVILGQLRMEQQLSTRV
jgi:hypothetical protein